MLTRRLEDREALLRSSVRSARLIGSGPRHLLFATTAVTGAKGAISSADSGMISNRWRAAAGAKVAGRLRLDLVAEGVVRVRYAEGEELTEIPSLLLVEQPAYHGSWTVSEDSPAKRVVALGGGLRIDIDTEPQRIVVHDATGRRLVAIGGPEKDNFNTWDTLNTGIVRHRDGGRPLAVENFDLRHDECVYGLGETFIKLDKCGQTIDLEMRDATAVHSPRSYKCIPFYVTNRGYGVFFNHTSLMTLWVGSASACDVQVAIDEDRLDYFVIAGDIKTVLHRYTGLTGRGVMPPDWTFGYWQSRISYKAADETLEVARQLRAHHIPCDVIHLDTHWFKGDWYCDLEFSQERFPDPAAYLAELRALGFRVSLWQLPYIPSGSKLYEELRAADGFVKNADGTLYDAKICFTPGFSGVVGVIDFTNPAAVRIHQDYLRRLFRLGASVIKTDFGEHAPAEGVYHDGTPGQRMHNLYPLLYNAAVSQVTREETGSGVVWARSAWAGGQRYPLHWGGDSSVNFENLAPQLVGGLSFGLSGFQFWSQDIGGFLGEPKGALLIRWMQAGMFMSHCRIHGFGDRELYKHDGETLRICRDYLVLRYRLMPYILGSARASLAASLPMMRALVLEFQNDPTTWRIDDQFLFGGDLLVAPICTEDGRRRAYLPAGTWTDWWTRARITGPVWLEVNPAIDHLPLWIREGGLIPLGPAMDHIGAVPTTAIELLVSPLEHDGERHFTMMADGTAIEVHYTRAAGRHVVTIPQGPVEVRIVALAPVDIALRRS